MKQEDRDGGKGEKIGYSPRVHCLANGKPGCGAEERVDRGGDWGAMGSRAPSTESEKYPQDTGQLNKYRDSFQSKT